MCPISSISNFIRGHKSTMSYPTSSSRSPPAYAEYESANSYPEDSKPYMEDSQSTYSQSIPSYSMATSTNPLANLPTSFSLWYIHQWSKIQLHLGTQKDTPLYFVNCPHDWHGELLLHSGPTIDSSTLAEVSYEGKWHSNMMMTLSLPTSSIDESSNHPSNAITTIRQPITQHSSLRKNIYTFSVPTLQSDGSYITESFSWTRAHKDELVDVTGHPGTCWKLLRDVPRRDIKNGEDILAVWKPGSYLKTTKAGDFEFVGDGIGEELGAAWRVAAVSCVLKIWKRQVELNLYTAYVS